MSIESLMSVDKTKISIFIALTVLIICGAVLRLYQLGHQSYWMDESYTINAVLSITQHGSTILDSGQNYSCPTYCYPTAYITRILGDNALSYRFLSALFGILFILVIFYITRKIFNQKIALLSSFFTTFSYIQITWSRQARWYTLFALFFWLAIYYFYQFINEDNNKIRNFILTIIFTTLTIFTHGLGYILPLIFIGWFMMNEIFIKRSSSWTKIFLSLATAIAGIFCLIYLLPNIHLSYELPYYLSFYIRSYWPFIILSLIAINISDTEHKNKIWYFTFVFLSYLLPLSFLSNIVHYRYLFQVTPVFLILASVAIVAITDNLPKFHSKILFLGAIFALFFVSGEGVLIPSNTYYLESDNPDTLGARPYYAYTPQPNWNGAYQYIKDSKYDSDIIISSLPTFNKIFLGQPGYWIKYNYLGLSDDSTPDSGKEFYVGAKIIWELPDLANVIHSGHGFIVVDYMALDGRIPQNIIEYIKINCKEVFYQKTNSFSQIWVYRF